MKQRIASQPSAEDYVLLGKLANEQGKPDAVLGHFREAIKQFPEDPIGCFATAGWLVHLGANDAEAATLGTKGFTTDPKNAYGHGVKAALCLLAKDGAGATAEIQAALKADPGDELANALRDGFFTVAK